MSMQRSTTSRSTGRERSSRRRTTRVVVSTRSTVAMSMRAALPPDTPTRLVGALEQCEPAAAVRPSFPLDEPGRDFREVGPPLAADHEPTAERERAGAETPQRGDDL